MRRSWQPGGAIAVGLQGPGNRGGAALGAGAGLGGRAGTRDKELW